MLSIECLRVHRDGETRNPVDCEQFERKNIQTVCIDICMQCIDHSASLPHRGSIERHIQ